MEFSEQQKDGTGTDQHGNNLKPVHQSDSMAADIRHMPAPPLQGCAENRLVVGEQDMLAVWIVHPLVVGIAGVVFDMPGRSHIVLECVGRVEQHIVIGMLQPVAVFCPEKNCGHHHHSHHSPESVTSSGRTKVVESMLYLVQRIQDCNALVDVLSEEQFQEITAFCSEYFPVYRAEHNTGPQLYRDRRNSNAVSCHHQELEVEQKAINGGL